MRRLALYVALFLTFASPAPRRVADITLTPGTTYNVNRGWEATAPGWRFEDNHEAFLQQIVDRGINRVRMEVQAGIENTTDYLAAYLNSEDACPNYPTVECDPGPTPGETPEGDALIANRYKPVNDNGDPDVIDASKFHWTGLDNAVTRTVGPMRTMLAARGESLYVNLCYVAFSNSIPPLNELHQDPDEYAEFMLAVFEHLEDTYGWVPNGIEVILEPDNSINFWGNSQTGSPTLMGQIIKATGDKLAANGYTPDFIAPSPTSYASVQGYIDGMQLVAGAVAYVKEMSYHKYNTTGGISSIAAASADLGVCSSMLEHWDPSNTFEVLYEAIASGNACAYQRGVAHPANEEDYYAYTQHYFRSVRMGATRIAASSSNGQLAPLAWINVNGAYAVVIKAASAQSFTVGDLPTGTYQICWTTASVTDACAADQSITTGEEVSANIPAAGVIRINANPLTSAEKPVWIRIGRGAF